MKYTRHIRTNLRGLKKSFWHRNMNGWFSIDGRELNNEEAHKMIDYCLEHGIVYDCDAPVEEIKELLGW